LVAQYEEVPLSDHPDTRRNVELLEQIDSMLSAHIQFAGWVAACIT